MLPSLNSSCFRILKSVLTPAFPSPQERQELNQSLHHCTQCSVPLTAGNTGLSHFLYPYSLAKNRFKKQTLLTGPFLPEQETCPGGLGVMTEPLPFHKRQGFSLNNLASTLVHSFVFPTRNLSGTGAGSRAGGRTEKASKNTHATPLF